mmetsp:Transcript_20328/g.60443  ORF Transcript_20328/g.60443 Transcript_20328/m.60443 type:complete len:214 (-) Transcript_20328:150-791(-)
MLMPHHYQVNSHWFTYVTHYNPLSPHPLAMRERFRPTEEKLLAGQHSRSWRWPRATLANFGVAQKLGPPLFPSLRLPLLVSRASLWLGGPGTAARRALVRELCAQGHVGGRLITSPRVLSSEYIDRATRATLYIDTLAYNSHTTMVDMLWAALPALTVSGGTIASRVGTAVGAAHGAPQVAVASLRELGGTATALLGPSTAPSAPRRGRTVHT